MRRVVALPRGARSLGDAVDAFLAQPDLAPSSRRSHGQTLSQLRYRCPPCKQILWPPLITSPIPPLPTKIAPLLSLPLDEYLAARVDPSPALFIRFQRGRVDAVENRLTPGGAAWICDQVARRLGLERWHPHQLRHTFGTAVEEELGDTRLTAELLGHSGLGSVAGYTKISRRRREEAAAALADRGF